MIHDQLSYHTWIYLDSLAHQERERVQHVLGLISPLCGVAPNLIRPLYVVTFNLVSPLCTIALDLIDPFSAIVPGLIGPLCIVASDLVDPSTAVMIIIERCLGQLSS